MTKHPYQTCLRMPLTLKEDMTTICDRYQINESDLMRRAIVEFVTNIQQNPNQTSRHMFIWSDTRTSLGHDTRQDLSVTMLRGLLRWGREGSGKGAWVIHRGGLSLRGMETETTPIPFSLPIPNILCQTFRNENLTATLCLTIAVLLGSVGNSFQRKGLD